MNIHKLKQAEALFLQKYPEGFLHPEMQAMGKKHKMDKMIELAQESFSKPEFKNARAIADNMSKVIGRSSMVSMFEKPKFKELMSTLNEKELQSLTDGLKAFLHGNQKKGFEAMVEVLRPAKLAKWSLMTILPNYYYPNDEVFVKPTTAKGVIQYFELEDLEYKPTPTWNFYERYRNSFLEMKAAVNRSVAPNNASFGGFLMMSM